MQSMRRGVLVLLLVACKSTSSEPPAASLAADLAKLVAEYKLPAIEAKVWRDGKLLDSARAGTVPRDARWHLGSNTKAMTALLVGSFVDQGTLRWTDTVGQIFTGMKIDPGYQSVTLDQLIRH